MRENLAGHFSAMLYVRKLPGRASAIFARHDVTGTFHGKFFCNTHPAPWRCASVA